MRNAPLLIALAVATTARADGARTLHLAVHGSVDSATVGAAIAKELGVDVEIVEGTCDVPCLDVGVDGRNIATIMFAPRLGSPRRRIVELGSDTAQWPLVITLLAGNVVRNEAQDVLSGLPPRDLERPDGPDPEVGEVPPAPATAEVPAEPGPTVALAAPVDPGPATPAAAPPPPPPPGEHRWLGLGFVPVLSTDLTHVGSVRHFLSVDLLVGLSGGSSGVTVSGIADIERGLVAGFQAGGVVAIAQRLSGTQVAGVASLAGEVDGVQVGGVAAVAQRVDGFQVAGVATVSRSSADHQFGGVAAFAGGDAGTQAAGVASVAGRDADVQLGGVATMAGRNVGLQAAGVAAVARGDANLQVGGVAAVARGTANIQIAGVVNVARRVRGIQLAPVNVASDVDGVQVGLVNVGGSADGFSFGLINIVPGGRYDLETAIDSSKMGTVLFRHGGRRWHNVYGIGGHPVNEEDRSSRSNDDIWMYGLGFGPSLQFDNTVVDLEAIGWSVNHGARHEDEVSILAQLRLSVAHHWGPFAIVAGGILNTYVTSDQESPLILERRAPGSEPESGVTVTVWPSAFIGLRI